MLHQQVSHSEHKRTGNFGDSQWGEQLVEDVVVTLGLLAVGDTGLLEQVWEGKRSNGHISSEWTLV